MSTTDKKTDVWLLTALAAPLTRAASGCSWLTVAIVGTGCLGLCWGAERLRKPRGRFFSGVQWLWLIFVIGMSLGWTADCWKDAGDSPVIGAALLLLAAWTATKGENVGSRAGNLLRFFLMVLIGGVLLSGLGDIRLSNLRPKWQMNTAHIVTLFLIPVAAAWTGCAQSSGKSRLALLLYASVTAAVVTGVLSSSYASSRVSAFYELSRSTELLGTARRFESLAGLGMTLGYYVFLTLLLTIAGNWAEWAFPGKRTLGIWLAAAGGMLAYLNGGIDDRALAIGSMALWIILPIFVGFFGKGPSENRSKDID